MKWPEHIEELQQLGNLVARRDVKAIHSLGYRNTAHRQWRFMPRRERADDQEDARDTSKIGSPQENTGRMLGWLNSNHL